MASSVAAAPTAVVETLPALNTAAPQTAEAEKQAETTNNQRSCICGIWDSFVECLSTIFSRVCCPCNYVLSWISGKTSGTDAKVQEVAAAATPAAAAAEETPAAGAKA